MKIKAKQRLESELTKKQKQLDINGDGKIDSTDLKKLREGEKPKKVESNFQTLFQQLHIDAITIANEAEELLELTNYSKDFNDLKSSKEYQDKVSGIKRSHQSLDKIISQL